MLCLVRPEMSCRDNIAQSEVSNREVINYRFNPTTQTVTVGRNNNFMLRRTIYHIYSITFPGNKDTRLLVNWASSIIMNAWIHNCIDVQNCSRRCIAYMTSEMTIQYFLLSVTIKLLIYIYRTRKQSYDDKFCSITIIFNLYTHCFASIMGKKTAHFEAWKGDKTLRKLTNTYYNRKLVAIEVTSVFRSTFIHYWFSVTFLQLMRLAHKMQKVTDINKCTQFVMEYFLVHFNNPLIISE